MDIKERIVSIDGMDKTGKDTIKRLLIKKSDGKILVWVRSFISQIVYSRIYDRQIDENYFKTMMTHLDSLGCIKFFMLIAKLETITQRFITHDEDDLNISDIAEHQSVFADVVQELRKEGVDIEIINTTVRTEDKIADDIMRRLYGTWEQPSTENR